MSTLFYFLHLLLSLLFSHWTQNSLLHRAQFYSLESEETPTLVLNYPPFKGALHSKYPLSQEPVSCIMLLMVSLIDHCPHLTTVGFYSEAYESTCLERDQWSHHAMHSISYIAISVVLNRSLIETTCWSPSRLPTVYLSLRNVAKTFYLVCKQIKNLLRATKQ